MSSPNYKIYPSLLDKFQRFLDADLEFESQWNVDSDGCYKRSFDEISAQLERELLDSVNRVSTPTTEAASRGTAFNILVDYLATPEICPSLNANGAGCIIYHPDTIPPKYAVSAENYVFEFDADFAERVAREFAGAITQQYTSATLRTRYGDVLLYGYPDEILMDEVWDIKTTSRYEFGKFADHWQRHVYPYCLTESGDMNSISQFGFYVCQLRERVGQPIDGAIYREVYQYDHADTTARLTFFCERFIEWLELHRGMITDTKIFGL